MISPERKICVKHISFGVWHASFGKFKVSGITEDEAIGRCAEMLELEFAVNQLDTCCFIACSDPKRNWMSKLTIDLGLYMTPPKQKVEVQGRSKHEAVGKLAKNLGWVVYE